MVKIIIMITPTIIIIIILFLAVSSLQQVIFSGVLNVIILNTDDKKVTGDKFSTCTISVTLF